MKRRRVLIIGATGYVASQLLPFFRKGYDLTLLDVKKTDGKGDKVTGVKIANLAGPDFQKYLKHFKGIDVVIHLGYHREPTAKGDRLPMEKRSYQHERINIDMAYNIYRLSHDAGVHRVIVASSNHATDWYERQIQQGLMDIVCPHLYPLPNNFYGWAKACYELMGFIFATGHFGRKLEIVHLRIGAPREIYYQSNMEARKRNYPDKVSAYKRDLGIYISTRDLQQLFSKSIETKNINNEYGVPFQIFYGISDNTRKFHSIINAKKIIGYLPDDDSEVQYAKDITEFLTSRKSR